MQRYNVPLIEVSDYKEAIGFAGHIWSCVGRNLLRQLMFLYDLSGMASRSTGFYSGACFEDG